MSTQFLNDDDIEKQNIALVTPVDVRFGVEIQDSNLTMITIEDALKIEMELLSNEYLLKLWFKVLNRTMENNDPTETGMIWSR